MSLALSTSPLSRRIVTFPPFLSWCPEGKETLRYEVPGEGMV